MTFSKFNCGSFGRIMMIMTINLTNYVSMKHRAFLELLNQSPRICASSQHAVIVNKWNKTQRTSYIVVARYIALNQSRLCLSCSTINAIGSEAYYYYSYRKDEQGWDEAIYACTGMFDFVKHYYSKKTRENNICLGENIQVYYIINTKLILLS